MRRLWGIRHLRYAYYCYRCDQHARFWAAMGIGLGCPHPDDEAMLRAIWEGRA